MAFKKTLGPVPRKDANVEAEKKETVLTNMSRGLNNIMEFYNIAGKRHGENGTPLNLPVDDEGTGASFIFSDRLKVTDPEVLKHFGVTKKTATIADISKNHLDIVNKSKSLLLDKLSDSISKRSAELNLENSFTTLNKLKLLQESMKGFKEGMPSGTEEYFKSMKMDPSSLFESSDAVEQSAATSQLKAFGGLLKQSKGPLPRFDIGGEFGEADTNAETQYYYIKDELGKNEGFKKALFEEYQKIKKNPDFYGKGYRSLLGDESKFKKFELQTPEDVYQAYLKMQERNLIFKSQGYNVAGTANDPSKNKEVVEWSKKHNVPLPNMDGIVKEQIAYWAFENLAKNRDAYSDDLKAVLQPFSANQFGSNDDKFRGQSSTITLADGAYTNTSAGQISNFQAPPARVDNNGDLTFEPSSKAPEGQPNTMGVKPDVLTAQGLLDNPLDYRSQDLRSIQRAVSSRLGIPKYNPFEVTPEIPSLDAAYYSPERAIAAINENVNTAANISKAFGDAQGATASASALAGSAFTATANVISDYADKNVNLFNNVAQANLELGIKRNMLDADTTNRLYADNVDMQEKFRRGVEMAKDKIVMLKNQAETNMADIYNLNLVHENYKKDPYSGLVYLTNETPLEPMNPNDQPDVAAEFSAFRSAIPNVSDDVAAKLFMGQKSGKWSIESDGFVTPQELNRTNAQ